MKNILNSEVSTREGFVKNDFLKGLEIEKGEYRSTDQNGTNPVMANQWNRSGRSDSTNGSSPYTTSKLYYPGYIDSGSDGIKLAATPGGRYTVYSLTDGDEYKNKPYYLAFMCKVEDISTLPESNSNAFIALDGNYAGNHFRGRVILKPGAVAGNVAFALGTSAVSENQTRDYEVGETILMVIKYNFFPSSRLTSLFINPSIADREPAIPDLVIESANTDMLGQIRGITIRQQGSYEMTVGGLRFSDKWTDAIGYTGEISGGTTKLINYDESGKLVYHPDENNFYLPDFSQAGYRGGGIGIPDVEVVKTISPIIGDNTAHIQAAIDEIGQMPLNENGHRGTLLLSAGKYEVQGRLYVNYSGIVIRGTGNDTSENTSTIIYATGNTPEKRILFLMGYPSQNTWKDEIEGTQRNITDDIVPVGSYSFSVENTSGYAVGDQIIIYHPCTNEWLEAVDYGGVPAPVGNEEDARWVEGQLPILFNRYITKIEGNVITVDVPLYYTLNKSLAQCYIYKFNQSVNPILKEIGIENLRIDIENAGGTDENHAWSGVIFRTAENCWAKNVIVKGFGFAGISLEATTRSTVLNCQAIDPVSIITGERRYNFNAGNNAQMILYKDCYASDGRHTYVSNGTSTTSGIVFLNCIADRSNDASESHMKWSQGLLYDNHRDTNPVKNFVLGLYNRINMGTGHGWSAVQSVLWNCDVTDSGVIGLQKPPTSQNYAIGCKAGEITGKPVNTSEFVSDFPIGYVESENVFIKDIPSLYLAQLEDRLTFRKK